MSVALDLFYVPKNSLDDISSSFYILDWNSGARCAMWANLNKELYTNHDIQLYVYLYL